MNNYMLDVETTGLDPSTNAITSVAVLPFDVDMGTMYVQRAIHCRLPIPRDRMDNAETMAWRMQHRVGPRERKLDELSFETFAMRLNHLVMQSSGPPIVWAKPSTFDIPFLRSYYARYRVESRDVVWPFHYRNVMDLRSYIKGTGFDAEEIYTYVGKAGAHDALADCVMQCEAAIRAKMLATHAMSRQLG